MSDVFVGKLFGLRACGHRVGVWDGCLKFCCRALKGLRPPVMQKFRVC